MKVTHSILVVGLAWLLQACYPNFTDMPLEQVQRERVPATYTIAQVKTDFLQKPNAFFSVDQISHNEDVIIEGIITSEDIAGNIYKAIVVQEEGDNPQAIRISIDAGSLSGVYPVGQRVSVKLNGLWIGTFGQSAQIGSYFLSSTASRVNNDPAYNGEPGRIAKVITDQHIVPYGLPDPNAVVPKEMTIAEIKAAGTELHNVLVLIKDATFTGKGSDFGKPATITAGEKIFAPSTNGVGFPQAREITDATGSIFIATSEYARFANKKLPTGTGDIIALVGWYNNKDITIDPTKIYHQLTIRSLKDLSGFTFPE
jgi:hypothetical protein